MLFITANMTSLREAYGNYAKSYNVKLSTNVSLAKEPSKKSTSEYRSSLNSMWTNGKLPPVEDELEKYMALPHCDPDVNILDWWKANAKAFPILAMMAKGWFSCLLLLLDYLKMKYRLVGKIYVYVKSFKFSSKVKDKARFTLTWLMLYLDLLPCLSVDQSKAK